MSLNVMRLSKTGSKWAVWMLITVSILSGCATTGSRQTQENIEISDNYNVDSDIRDEFERAVELLKKGQNEEAIKILQAVTGKARKFTAPYINLAIAYKNIGELDKAEENLNKALKLNKRHPAANNELALVYRKTGRFVEAKNVYEMVLKDYPNYLPARKNLGVLCDLYMRDLKCALQQYEAYLNVLPDDEKVKIWVADVKSRM